MVVHALRARILESLLLVYTPLVENPIADKFVLNIIPHGVIHVITLTIHRM